VPFRIYEGKIKKKFVKKTEGGKNKQTFFYFSLPREEHQVKLRVGRDKKKGEGISGPLAPAEVTQLKVCLLCFVVSKEQRVCRVYRERDSSGEVVRRQRASMSCSVMTTLSYLKVEGRVKS
jgi:hypothetical protein